MHNVLVIGVGSIGERHTRCFQITGRAQMAICEPNDALRADVAERYGIEESYASLDDALREQWDTAVIASPAHTHIPIAAQLTNAGVGFLMEKPVSTTMDGVEELLGLVEKRGILAGVGYTYRAHPACAAMKAAVDEGRFGKPLQVYASLGQVFAKYRPAYANVYFADRAQGGGAIQDAITHFVSLGEWLVGPMTRVLADADHLNLEGVDVEDTVHLLARHGDVMATYALNLYQKANESTITVVCENGMARYEIHERRLRWMTEADGPWHEEHFPVEDRDDWFVIQANAFLDALEGKRELLCSLAEGVQTLRVNLAALRSVESGTWETIDA